MTAIPLTLWELAEQIGSTVSRLPLKCVFCKKSMNGLDKYNFGGASFNPVLKEGAVYGCCLTCAREAARQDLRKNCTGLGTRTVVEAVTGLSLGEIGVRCVCCMRHLSQLEKVEVSCRGELYYRVRDKWRARCRQCAIASNNEGPNTNP
ncbi:E6 protein [Tree shrew papillomavirus 2]|uniref:Protein E6 n=1 Tax=Tree shrew papillomavirus 2 TaxID=2562516 RepID=A0AAE6D0N9_9PAPI|nr:E6 protein [Tree shrew papillomavirus 2]